MCDEQRGDNLHMALYTITEHWHWPLEETFSCFQTYRILLAGWQWCGGVWCDRTAVAVVRGGCGVGRSAVAVVRGGCGVGRSAVAVVWCGGV